MFGTFKHDQQGRSRSPARDEGVRPTQKLMTTDDRYSRQVLFFSIGEEGQRLIRQATVAVAGCGALGAFQAGALARAGRSACDGMVVLSSRVSIELVQKAARMGVRVLVAVSAPTALAVRVADAAGMTVVGVARDDGFEVFCGHERVSASF